MGFSTLIDILGSTIIGGMLLLILFRVNDTAVQNNYTYSGDLIVQEGLVEAVNIIEYDFRKIGYCLIPNAINPDSSAIISADSNRIKFMTDLAIPNVSPRGDGVVDTLEYYLGPASELDATSNPRDRILYRVVNNETPVGSNIGITEFKLTYFNSMGDTLFFPISEPLRIYTMQIDVKIENTEGVGDMYKEGKILFSSAIWRQIRLVARNLEFR